MAFTREEIILFYIDEFVPDESEMSEHLKNYIWIDLGYAFNKKVKTGFQIAKKDSLGKGLWVSHHTCIRKACNNPIEHEVKKGRSPRLCSKLCRKLHQKEKNKMWDSRRKAMRRYDRDMDERLKRYAEEDGLPSSKSRS